MSRLLALAAQFALPIGLIACPPQSQPGLPAEFFPDHTYFYVQVHPFAGVAGYQNLKLANLLKAPTIGGLFDRVLESIPPESDPRKMLSRYPFDKVISDRIALGLVGFKATTRATDREGVHTYQFPEDGPMPPDLFANVDSFEGEVLFAVAVKDEPLFLDTLARFLTDTVFDGKPVVSTIEDADGTAIRIWDMPGMGRAGKLYSAFADGYFLLAQNKRHLASAMARQRAKGSSLSTRSDFIRFASHRAEKPTAAFLHLGIDSAIELFSPLIPQADRDDMAMWGAFDYSGLQVGMGFHDGGICEWLHLAFAENPRGVLMNLGRLWPSMGYVEAETDRGTVYAASLTFDWAALYNTTMLALGLCGVDTTAFRTEANASLGLDIRDDLMGAFGNTIGAVTVLPRVGFIPEFSLVFKVRNRAKMEKVLGRLVEACEASGMPTKRFPVPGGGPNGTYVSFGKEIPIKPAFALTGDKLVVSTMPLTLKSAISQSRTTGRATVDLVPDASADHRGPLLSWFFDPAPVAVNLYADLLKIIDSSDRRLPIDVADLPTPEFVADALSPFGVEFAIDPYYMSVDLHSPTGIAIPALIAASMWAQQQAQDAAAQARAQAQHAEARERALVR